MDQNTTLIEAFRHVAQLWTVAAMTAPKSGEQFFLKGAKPPEDQLQTVTQGE
jgi:hypothetical protein